MSDSDGIFTTLLCLLFILIINGVIDVTYAYNYSSVYTGTLIKASVVSQSSGNHNNNNNYFYLAEQFRFDTFNVTSGDYSLCTVTRPKSYYYYGDADNVATKTKLNTQRKIYIYKDDRNVCYDTMTQLYYGTIGITFLSVSGFILFIPVIIITYGKLKTVIKRHRFQRYQLPTITEVSNTQPVTIVEI